MPGSETKKARDRERMKRIRAAQMSIDRVSKIVLSYEPLVGSVVYDLERALRANISYNEVSE